MTTQLLPIWGREHIDPNAIEQMEDALTIPPAICGALMPDAHKGYFVPVGGVLALDNAVCPYAVGPDIACRMRVSIWDINADELIHDKKAFIATLERACFFGTGKDNQGQYKHPVLEKDWGITEITKSLLETARRQVGTSGSGNHFVEFGVVNGKVALMSHSGSRGPGSKICTHYTRIAKELHPEAGDGAWLDLDTEAGQEYWAAMNLMGEFASANHQCIHDEVTKNLGEIPCQIIENHHNFAWRETHFGREMIVHRKGATPAGYKVQGVIPGSMGTPAFLVEGLGNEASLCSASHGAGRLLSRTVAKKTFNLRTELDKLASRGITVLSCGADEVCGVYKNIDEVMAAQTDLVKVIGRFDPKIVKMCGSNDRAED